MKATLDSIKETATELKDRIPDFKESFTKVTDHMRQHPIPYAIAGTGLACAIGYALTSSVRRKNPEVYLEETQSRIGDAAHSAREKIASTASSLAESAKNSLDSAKDKVAGVTESISGKVHDARDKTLNFVDEKPFLVGAGVVAAGFIAGLLLPSSRKENNWFGEKKDQLLTDAKAAGQKLMDDGKQILQEGKALVEEGAEKAKNAVMSADHAVRDAVNDTGKSVRNEIAKAEDKVVEKADEVKRAATA